MANARKANEFFRAAREHLRQLAGVDQGRKSYGGGGASAHSRSATAGGLPRQMQARPGAYNVRYGVEPTDADVNAFIKAMGGNPYVRAGRTAAPQQSVARQGNSYRAALAARQPGQQAPSPRDLFAQLASDYQMKLDEANAANEFRYQQGLGLLGDVAARNQGRVENWGKVQEQLNAERAAESLKSQKAYLASRGLSNSNVFPALQARSDRDLALVQQDLSERRDARASEYDTRDTGNVVGFVERRYDNAPDPSMFMQMAQQLATADAYQQMRENAPSGRQVRTQPQRIQQAPRGVSPRQAAMMQANVAGQFAPMAAAGMQMFNPVRWGGVQSNRFPTRRDSNQLSYDSVRRAAPAVARGAANVADTIAPAIAPAMSPAYYAAKYGYQAAQNAAPVLLNAFQGMFR